MARQNLLAQNCRQKAIRRTDSTRARTRTDTQRRQKAQSVRQLFHVGSTPKGEAKLPKLYTPVLGEKAHFDVQASALGDKASEVLKDLLQRLHNGEKINADRKLLRATASDYTEALQRGYGKKITDLDWDSPDFETLQNMTENVYQFAAAKNYHELRDLTDALRDGERIRSFEEFEQIAKPIIGKYNQHWLRTEYNQAVASAQAGSHWNDFKRHQKEMPFLRYQCVMDGNTRPDHADLDGTIKRIDDDFWTKYMPPNGWGCRCEAVQLPGSDYTETPDDQIKYPEVAEMFQVNFGQRGVAFPEGHAYFKQMPKKVWKGLEKKVRNSVLDYYQKIALADMSSTGNDLIAFSNLQTGKLKRSNKIKERVVNPRHARTIEETKAAHYAWNNPDKLHFERVSELGEGKDIDTKKDRDNLNKKSNRGVVQYIQYSFQYNGVKYHIKTEKLADGYEQLYSLTKP